MHNFKLCFHFLFKNTSTSAATVFIVIKSYMISHSEDMSCIYLTIPPYYTLVVIFPFVSIINFIAIKVIVHHVHTVV